MSDRYVQHISGEGEKWELAGGSRPCNSDMNHPCWVVSDAKRFMTYELPKSEYRLVEPPETWVDVTQTFDVEPSGWVAKSQIEPGFIEVFGHNFSRYRLRKITLGTCAAFIIEKRQP